MKFSFYFVSLISLGLSRCISSSLLKFSHTLLINTPSSATSSSTNDSDCSDGVCSINPSNKTDSSEQINMPDLSASSSTSPSTSTTESPEFLAKIEELGKLGYSSEESRRALLAADSDIERAIVALEEAEEKQKELDLAVRNITDLGWRKEVSFVLLLVIF